jgi:hypothetical protein
MKPIRSALAILGTLAASACVSSYADSRPNPSPFATTSDSPTDFEPAAETRACDVERATARGPYGVDIRGTDERSLPTFQYRSHSWVMGSLGDRYEIHLANHTARRVEAVVSVDGLDAVDGHTADYQSKRGYLIPAYGEVTIEGFRTSLEKVATFRFSSVPDSYAGRKGQARDVGVIGVAFFPEREVRPRPLPMPLSSPRRDASEPSAAPPPAPSVGESAASGAAAPAARASDAVEKSRGESYERRASREVERPGLGTEFGEQRSSSVEYTSFQRQNAGRPTSVVELRYNDRRGLLAMGIAVDGCSNDDVALRETADPFRANRFAAPPPAR